MISDTLFDAIAEIRDYQRRLPQMYDGMKAEIDSVVARMEALKEFFDTRSPSRAQLDALRTAIGVPLDAPIPSQLASEWLKQKD
ncbi:MAG: hypothetical protein JO128_09620 [Alphaproteobacteria bacterium]|nr:hypothetical protein [Alphaproteobacteria bacterium]